MARGKRKPVPGIILSNLEKMMFACLFPVFFFAAQTLAYSTLFNEALERTNCEAEQALHDLFNSTAAKEANLDFRIAKLDGGMGAQFCLKLIPFVVNAALMGAKPTIANLNDRWNYGKNHRSIIDFFQISFC
jgi:hypothetical protein